MEAQERSFGSESEMPFSHPELGGGQGGRGGFGAQRRSWAGWSLVLSAWGALLDIFVQLVMCECPLAGLWVNPYLSSPCPWESSPPPCWHFRGGGYNKGISICR